MQNRRQLWEFRTQLIFFASSANHSLIRRSNAVAWRTEQDAQAQFKLWPLLHPLWSKSQCRRAPLSLQKFWHLLPFCLAHNIQNQFYDRRQVLLLRFSTHRNSRCRGHDRRQPTQQFFTQLERNRVQCWQMSSTLARPCFQRKCHSCRLSKTHRLGCAWRESLCPLIHLWFAGFTVWTTQFGLDWHSYSQEPLGNHCLRCLGTTVWTAHCFDCRRQVARNWRSG